MKALIKNNVRKLDNYARSLIEASLDPLVTISAQGKITDVNEASIKVTGIPREKLVGTDFSNYFTDPKKAQEGYLQVFEKGFVADYPLTIKHKNGKLTDVLYNATVYKDDKGNVLGVFAAARDVTEQKWAIELRKVNKELSFQNDEKEKRASELITANKELAYQNELKEKRAQELVIANQELAFQNQEKEKRANELRTINKELEQFAHANKELKQFAYISSHELKEPLRTIGNFIQIINEDYALTLNEKIIIYLGKIDDSVKRMNILISSLVNFSKLGSNKKLSHVDCKEIIDSVVSDLTAIIASSNARIEVSEMPKLNIYEIEFRQIFQNLITNAIKFRKKGTPPIIQIRSENINETYRFSVSDNGIGIDPIHFDRVFNIFQRLHNTEAEFEGKGLGLAYCKKIVQLHKGDIWVESELGKGSTFYFTIFPIL
jgi:PAS domain S-box-containing protein